jgi:PAS domain S-box-containing protein
MDREMMICDKENSFKVLFCQNPLPMWIVEIETLKFLAVNDACIKHYGYSRSEFLQGSLLMIRHLKEYEDTKQLIANIKNKQTVNNLTHIKKDGTSIRVQITSYAVSFHNRSCKMVIIRDITLQKLRDDKLKEAWQRVRQTLDSVTDGFFTLDQNLNITYLNKEAGRIMGISKHSALNRNFFSAFPNLKNTAFLNHLTAGINDSKKVKFEEYLPCRDKWICSTVYPNGSGIAVYFTDITKERKALQLIADYDKRFEELAHLNSHQMRKEVANILGILNLIEHNTTQSDDHKELLEMLNTCVIKLDHIIVDINTCIED